jgi:hypothetical protein
MTSRHLWHWRGIGAKELAPTAGQKRTTASYPRRLAAAPRPDRGWLFGITNQGCKLGSALTHPPGSKLHAGAVYGPLHRQTHHTKRCIQHEEVWGVRRLPNLHWGSSMPKPQSCPSSMGKRASCRTLWPWWHLEMILLPSPQRHPPLRRTSCVTSHTLDTRVSTPTHTPLHLPHSLAPFKAHTASEVQARRRVAHFPNSEHETCPASMALRPGRPYLQEIPTVCRTGAATIAATHRWVTAPARAPPSGRHSLSTR